MRIKKELVLSYCMAIGILNLILTITIVPLVSWIFSIPLTWERFGESYLIGYLILGILNIKIITSNN